MLNIVKCGPNPGRMPRCILDNIKEITVEENLKRYTFQERDHKGRSLHFWFRMALNGLDQ